MTHQENAAEVAVLLDTFGELAGISTVHDLMIVMVTADPMEVGGFNLHVASRDEDRLNSLLLLHDLCAEAIAVIRATRAGLN